MTIADLIEKCIPPMTNRLVRNEDLRKTFHPIPIVNSPSVLLGLMGFSSVFIGNKYMRLPLLTGMHYAILFAAGGIWAGYNLQRISLRSKMGQVKYAMDFMERHKEDIPERKPVHFGDPEWLNQWVPIR